jgi:predicted acylesterase/phospholipase RssA
LYQKLIDKSERKNNGLFDIVAGTSAGAINALLLVSYVTRKGIWVGSAEMLCKFWKDI